MISGGLAEKIHSSCTPSGVPCSQAWRDTAKTIEDSPDYRLHPQGRPCRYAGRNEGIYPAVVHEFVREAEAADRVREKVETMALHAFTDSGA